MAEPSRNAEEGGRKRAREVVAAIDSVMDEEVEEFCAILQRIRRPVKYFGREGLSARGKRWRPSFLAEDFNGVDGGVKHKETEKKTGGGGGVLDLNDDPVTE
ncbi:unnamed protein product [Rhodiola kirilowii]